MRYIAAALSLMLLSGCLVSCKDDSSGADEDRELTFTVINHAGADISSIYAGPEATMNGYADRLTEKLTDGSSTELSLGVLSEDDLAKGILMEVYNADDGSSQTFSQLHISSGSTVTFYYDESISELCAAVDMTDEEIEEMLSREALAYGDE